MEKLRPFELVSYDRLEKLHTAICDALFCVMIVQDELWLDKLDTKLSLEDIKMGISAELHLKKKANKTE